MIKPREPYILIEPLDQETTLKSGIVIPDTAKEHPQMGKIISVNEYSELEVDSKVYYKKWAGNETKFEGKDLILIDEEDILAIVEENE